jgi:hypothetical protein
MAGLRARIDELSPPCPVVIIYAIDAMASIGKTASARHAARGGCCIGLSRGRRDR